MAISRAEKFFQTHMMEGYRDTTTNWLGWVRQVKDGYERFFGVAHGVQKDAIQNGWDARRCKRGTDWAFEFELVDSGKKFFIMTDRGTKGLTGKVITNHKEYFEDMPEEYRWARFESLAFTKGSVADLGSRGRGKFIFVAASKENVIFYDTLLDDGTYRLGARVVTQTESPVIHWEGEEAKKKLHEITGGRIEPLGHLGARVIISDPIDELIQSLVSGDFEKYISETWWEIIQKYNAEIHVTIEGERRRVRPPEGYPLPEKDDKTTGIKTHVVELKTLRGTGSKINKLHVVYNPSGIDPALRGIAIQRGCMKVTCIEPRFIPPDKAEGIYGYITVDRALEGEIRNCENDEHYHVSFRNRKTKRLRDFIFEEISQFATKKLGCGKDPRESKREMHRRAEQLAMDKFNRIAEEVGLRAAFAGTHNMTRERLECERVAKEVHVHFPDPEFPSPPSRKVNYGGLIKGIIVSAVNNSCSHIGARLKLFIHAGKGNVIETLVDEVIDLEPESSSEEFGPFETTITQELFPDKGKYSITAVLESIGGEKSKGYRLDRRSKTFYVEQEPPKGGFIEKCQGANLGVEDPIMGFLNRGESGGYTLVFNAQHNEYDDLGDDENRIAQYLYRIMAFEVCRLDLLRESPIVLPGIDIEEPEGMITKVFDKVSWFMHKYYQT